MEPMSILWVGPGMGEPSQMMPWWLNTWEYLINHQGFQVSHLKLIDLIDEPLPFFGEKWAKNHGVIQEVAKQDFFSILAEDEWDIIIVDFVEAWLLGKRFWPDLSVTPMEWILARWEQKLQQLRPREIWVVHDTIPESTIIPELPETYNLIVDTERRINDSKLWDAEALKQFTFWKRLAVWQRKDLRINPDESIREIEKAWKSEPNLHNFDRYYQARLRVGNKLVRDEVASELYRALRDVVLQAPKGQIKTQIEPSGAEFWSRFDPEKQLEIMTNGMEWDKKIRQWYGPIFEICLRDGGGVSIGAGFIKLIIDAEHREFCLERLDSIYKIPESIMNYFYGEIIRIFVEAGWSLQKLPRARAVAD